MGYYCVVKCDGLFPSRFPAKILCARLCRNGNEGAGVGFVPEFQGACGIRARELREGSSWVVGVTL